MADAGEVGGGGGRGTVVDPAEPRGRVRAVGAAGALRCPVGAGGRDALVVGCGEPPPQHGLVACGRSAEDEEPGGRIACGEAHVGAACGQDDQLRDGRARVVDRDGAVVDEESVLEGGVEGQGDVRAGGELELSAHEGPVRRRGRGDPAGGSDRDGEPDSALGERRQVGVVLEARGDVEGARREERREASGAERGSGVLAAPVVGGVGEPVGGAAACGEERQLASADDGVRRYGGTVLDRSGEDPGDELEPGVGVRRDVERHALVRPPVGGEMLDEAPGSDEPARSGERARTARSPRRGREQLGRGEGGDRLGCWRSHGAVARAARSRVGEAGAGRPAARDGRSGCHRCGFLAPGSAVDVAHGPEPRPAGASWRGSWALVPRVCKDGAPRFAGLRRTARPRPGAVRRVVVHMAPRRVCFRCRCCGRPSGLGWAVVDRGAWRADPSVFRKTWGCSSLLSDSSRVPSARLHPLVNWGVRNPQPCPQAGPWISRGVHTPVEQICG